MPKPQYTMACEDAAHPDDLGFRVEVTGPLEFVLGAARNHLRRHLLAEVTIARSEESA